MFIIEDGRDSFYQWDLNRRLIVRDNSITEVHFCNRTDECSLVVEVYEENGSHYANVPNILLQTDWRINVYAYDSEYTKHSMTFHVNARTKPAGYVYTETEVKTWETLERDVHDAMEAGISAMTKVAQQYFSNALNGFVSGKAVTISDASPVEHMLNVKVRRKNYFDVNALEPLYGATIDVNNNNQLTITTSYAQYPGCRCKVLDKNMYGKTVTLSFAYEVLNLWVGDETYKKCKPNVELAVYDSYGDRVLYKIVRGSLVASEALSLTVELPAYEEGMYMTLSFHVSNSVDGSAQEMGRQVIFSNIQLEDGAKATAWSPYVKDLSKVTVSKFVNWVLREKYPVSADGLVLGVTSDYGYVRLISDTEGTIIDCMYNRDINKAFAALTQALASMGANI